MVSVANALGAVNTAGLGAIALQQMAMQARIDQLVTGKPDVRTRFVNPAATVNGVGTLASPYKSMGDAFTALGVFATDEDSYLSPVVLELAPADYSAETGLVIPQRAMFVIHAPGSILPKLTIKPRLDKQFGSIVLPGYVVAGDFADDVIHEAFFAQDELPGSAARIGDGTSAFDMVVDTASSTAAYVTFRNADVRGSVVFTGDWFGTHGFGPVLIASQCTFQTVGAGIEQGVGATTPVGTLVFSNVYITQGTYVVDVERVNGFTSGYADGLWTVQDTPGGGLYVIAGFVNVWVASGFSWTGPVLSMFLDGYTNFWVTTNGSTVAAGDKTVMEDDTP